MTLTTIDQIEALAPGESLVYWTGVLAYAPPEFDKVRRYIQKCLGFVEHKGDYRKHKRDSNNVHYVPDHSLPVTLTVAQRACEGNKPKGYNRFEYVVIKNRLENGQ